jgi:hypothetical protein
MSRLLITVDTDNAIFQTVSWQQEASKVLATLAIRLRDGSNQITSGLLRDSEGADCGAWDYEPDEP